MSLGNPSNLQPSVSPEETVPVEFDFAPWIDTSYDTAMSIASVGSINVTVAASSPAQDPTPQARTIGTPVIVPSSSDPTKTAGAIAAWFGTMLPGVIYMLQAVAVMSDGRSQPSTEVFLQCYDPNADP